MTDVVERLRAGEPCQPHDDVCRSIEARSGCICAEAADEIERRRADIAHLDTKLDDALDEIERLRAEVAYHKAFIKTMDGQADKARSDALEEAAKVAENHKPVAWMVREPDGSLHWSEMCVFEDEASAKDHAENPEGIPDGYESNFTVVPLYTHPSQADTDEIERLRKELAEERAKPKAGPVRHVERKPLVLPDD
jgi:hypothetical protein